MKKIFLCLIALMALVACNNKSENQNVAMRLSPRPRRLPLSRRARTAG